MFAKSLKLWNVTCGGNLQLAKITILKTKEHGHNQKGFVVNSINTELRKATRVG